MWVETTKDISNAIRWSTVVEGEVKTCDDNHKEKCLYYSYLTIIEKLVLFIKKKKKKKKLCFVVFYIQIRKKFLMSKPPWATVAILTTVYVRAGYKFCIYCYYYFNNNYAENLPNGVPYSNRIWMRFISLFK